jgi:transposase InsO family protein
VQQARNATAWCDGPRFLVRDRDGRFTKAFDVVFAACGTKLLRTPPQTPVANAFCERLIGTLRRELLDHLIALGEDHLRTRLTEFFAHYHAERPHRGLCLRVPARAKEEPPPEVPLRSSVDVVAMSVLGGLTHHYERRAA